MMGLLQVPQGFRRALGRLPKQSPILFQFRRDVFLSARKGEVVNAV